MANFTCPAFATLFEYARQQLPLEKKLEIQKHVITCLSCQLELWKTQKLVHALESDAALQIPVNATAKAVSLYRAWYQKPPKPLSLLTNLRHAVVELVSDTRSNFGWQVGLAAGLRSTGLNQPYQLLYSIERGRFEIDLQISPFGIGSGQHFTLIGQILGTSEMEQSVELTSLSSGSTFSTKTDQAGTFRLQKVPADNYSLTISSDGEKFEINPLVIASSE